MEFHREEMRDDVIRDKKAEKLQDNTVFAEVYCDSW
jgi:SOS response regulatory protein OraA/RecX